MDRSFKYLSFSFRFRKRSQCYTLERMLYLRQKEEEQVRRGNMCCLGCLHHHDQPCSVGVCVYLHTRVESYHHPHIMRFERPSRLLSFLTCYIASSTQHALIFASQWCRHQCRKLVGLFTLCKFPLDFFTFTDYSKLPLGVSEYDFRIPGRDSVTENEN